MSSESLRAHALRLANRGFYIFPLAPNSARPVSKFSEESTDDLAQVDRLWRTESSNRNIGVHTGKPFDDRTLFVLDIDDHHGGMQSLMQLVQEHGPLPQTYIVGTPSGGLHYYYTAPYEVRNSEGVIGEGLDIRGTNGFVVAEGSRRVGVAGKRDGGYVAKTEDLPQPAPEWLLDLAIRANSITAKAHGHAAPAAPANAPTEDGTLHIKSGTRNTTLFKEACGLRGKGYGFDAILSAITALNASQADTPLSDDALRGIAERAVAYEPNTPVHEYEAKPAASLGEQIGNALKGLGAVMGSADNSSEGPGALPSIGWQELVARDLPELPSLLGGPLITEQSVIMIHGARGVGKTQLGMSIGLAVAGQSPVLDWTAPPEPAGVFYLDAEMSQRVVRKRLQSLTQYIGSPVAAFDMHTTDLDLQAPMANLSTEAGRDAIELALAQGDYKMVVFDNLSTLQKDGDENSKEGWLPIQDFIIRLRAQGYCVIIVHHSGKSGDQRGFSGHEDVLDAVIRLDKHPDAAPGGTVDLKLTWTKHRHNDGSYDTAPFRAQMIDGVGWLRLDDSFEDKAFVALRQAIDEVPDISLSGLTAKLMEALNLKRAVARGYVEDFVENNQQLEL